MTELDKLIHYYEVILEVRAYPDDSAIGNQVQRTIDFLKELKKLKGEE